MKETEELSRIEKQAEFLEEYVAKNFGKEYVENISGLYKTMIEGNVGIEAPNDIKNNPLIVTESKYLYTQRNNQLRKEIKEKVATLLESKPRPKNDNYTGKLILPTKEINDLTLNNEQKLSIEKAFDKQFLIITGGPGTGKTTTVKYIIKNLLKYTDLQPKDIIMCAPTGKAQARMKESVLDKEDIKDVDNPFHTIGQNSTTIHRLLGKYNMRLRYNDEKPIPYKLIVVDECSMIDISLFHNLLMAINPKTTKLILLGDQYQLPPIGLGAVFTEMCETDSLGDNIVKLITSNRFKDNSLIKHLADDINTNRFGAILDEKFGVKNASSLNDDDVFYIIAQKKEKLDIEVPKNNDWRTYFEAQIANNVKSFKTDKNFNLISKHTILSATNKGKNGVNKICESIHSKVKKGDNPFVEGQLVLVTLNQPDLKIFNGDIGIVINENETYYVKFPNGLKIKPQTIIEHKLGYALSIHKSQGSEYENVLIIMSDASEKSQKMLNRQLLYTAVTRAKDLVVIQTTKKILEQTIGTNDERVTNIF